MCCPPALALSTYMLTFIVLVFAWAAAFLAYLLGLLAMIKCSICSYQCDNWYVSNWRLACHINFWLGERSLELAQGPQRVALAWHFARSSTPSGVTIRKAHRHLLLNKNLHRAISDCLCINLRLQHPHLQLLHQWWSWKAADWLSIRYSWGAHINKKKKTIIVQVTLATLRGASAQQRHWWSYPLSPTIALFAN